MTKGQQFANDMRHFLAIGTRTRRDRKGLDLHREIADWIRVAAMERGTLDASQEESFRPAYDVACSWFKWIKLGRADYTVCEYVNNLTPYQFCAFLGQMIDAGITSTSQAGQYFSDMRATLVEEAREDDAAGQTEAAEPAPQAQAATPTRLRRRAQARTARRTLRDRTRTQRAASRIRREGVATLATHVVATGLPIREARTVASSLRRNAAKAGVTGTAGISYTHGRARQCTRYTVADVRAIARLYKPRKPAYRLAAAKLALAA